MSKSKKYSTDEYVTTFKPKKYEWFSIFFCFCFVCFFIFVFVFVVFYSLDLVVRLIDLEVKGERENLLLIMRLNLVLSTALTFSNQINGGTLTTETT